MKNKLLTISIILILLSVMMPAVMSEDTSSYNQDIKESFLKLKSNVNLNWNETETSEPIMPGTSEKEFALDITYTTEYTYKISTLFINLMKNREITVKLEILEIPDWCQASLDTNTVTTTVSTEQQNLSATLSVSVNEDAIAYQTGMIKMNVSVEPQMGPLGALLLISGYNEIYELSITTGFLPEISTSIDYENYSQTEMIEIPPYNETIVPIGISNLGNDKTKVLVEITDLPENWTVDINSDITIDINSSGQIKLAVEANHEFDNETITIKLTPVRSQDTTEMGESTTLTINFENDGSYKEPSDDEFEIDTTMLALILIVIILVIIALAVFLRRK